MRKSGPFCFMFVRLRAVHTRCISPCGGGALLPKECVHTCAALLANYACIAAGGSAGDGGDGGPSSLLTSALAGNALELPNGGRCWWTDQNKPSDVVRGVAMILEVTLESVIGANVCANGRAGQQIKSNALKQSGAGEGKRNVASK